MNRTEELPQKGELWVCYHESQNPESDESRLSVVECLGESDGELGELHRKHMVGTPYRARYLWEADHPEFNGDVAESISNWMFHTRLADDADVFDNDYFELLNYARGFLTNTEILELLTGGSISACHREGYDALRTFALGGVYESITEWSIGHGHGPTRYGMSVFKRVNTLPECVQLDALESEKNRWECMGFDSEEAAYTVEVLLTMEEILAQDQTDEITELVNEYNLPYDAYIDGHFTMMDCPHCTSELIERPKRDKDYIRLDCSDCNKQYEGVETPDGLMIDREITEDN